MVSPIEDHWFAEFPKVGCELPESPAPCFHLEDGELVVETDPMPEQLAIASDLLNEGTRPGFERDGDIIDIRAKNGRWVYKIVGWHDSVTAVAQKGYEE
jgi:hypothetical protein